MNFGQLNRRLKLQKAVMTTDSEGVSAEAWTDVSSVWAAISPASAQETLGAAQTEEHITHDVTIRWRRDVSPKMRFLYAQPQGARIFLIHTILDPDESHRELDCKCEEFVTLQVGAA